MGWETAVGMGDLGYDRIAVLNYLKQAVIRVRAIANATDGTMGSDMLAMADEIAVDVEALEAELIAKGYIRGLVDEA
jgi:hypothetical protein